MLGRKHPDDGAAFRADQAENAATDSQIEAAELSVAARLTGVANTALSAGSLTA